MKFKMKVMQFDKGMGALDIAQAISKAQGIPKVDRIPWDYPPEKEVLMFVVVDGKKLDKLVADKIHYLNDKSTANIAFIGVGAGSQASMEKLAEMAKEAGIKVAGIHEVPVKSSLFKKGKASAEDIKAAVEFAAKMVESI